MTRDGLGISVRAGATLVVALSLSALLFAGNERESAVQTCLAVQTALQQGRQFIAKSDYLAAVRVLEGQLSKINGDKAYLDVLRDAYRGAVKELRIAKQNEEAQRYLERLQILDPGAAMDGSMPHGAKSPTPAIETPPLAVKEGPVARGKVDEQDDPFRDPKKDKQKTARGLLAQAEEEFTKNRFREAGALFDQAHQADATATDASKERWAYCLLHRVVQQLNEPANVPPAYAELEKETRRAVEMAPRLDYGKQVLAEIGKRRAADKTPALSVKHAPRGADGWACAETPNFRVFHNQTKELAEQVAQTAERTRATMSRKWFGGFKDDWNPRCDLYLHATSADYSQATGVPAGSPGHSSFKTEGSRVTMRRIDLHCDDPENMLRAVLPHEATHVVLAGQFGDQAVPRWADEGIAVLTEPRDKVEGHLHNLGKCRAETGLFSVKQLMTMPDYPEPRYISTFYAQSVSLVDFLAGERGPETLTKFLRSAGKDGYEASLKQHYGYRSFDELQQKWDAKALANAQGTAATGLAQGGR